MGHCFSHLTLTDRYRIEDALQDGKKPQEIADKLHVHVSTIYREIKRARMVHRNSDWTEEERYNPDEAHRKYRRNLEKKGAGLKIGNDLKLADYLEKKVIDDGYSPAAALASIKLTPLDDAIIQQTVIATNGIFKGCNVTYARGNVLHVSQGFGMIKGRFFEVYDCEVGVILNSGSGTLQGRLYIHMDLSNADEPIQLLTETASVLTDLTGDEDVNYNNTAYDLELATFGVTRTGITNLVPTFEKITGASGSGGASSLQRSTAYYVGDFVTCKNAPGWVTLYCTTAGETAAAEPVEYAGLAQVGDRVTDGTCVFTARDVVGEIDVLKDLFTDTETSIAGLEDGLQELREELNHKAENLPPPVGTIKYSAADPGPEWVKCDGSFVSEDDYPELIPLLNHKELTATDLLTAYKADKAGGITNTCVFNGSIWAYLVDAHLLVSVPPTGTAKIIPVSGAEALSGASPVYLSICGGSLYLTQIGGTGCKIILFELVDFSGTETSITVTEINLNSSSNVNMVANQYTIPYVVDVGGTKIFASRIVCGDCGAFFGPKVWHSDSKYRRIIWQCNEKFNGEKKCATPHLREEDIKARFLAAFNQLLGSNEPLFPGGMGAQQRRGRNLGRISENGAREQTLR